MSVAATTFKTPLAVRSCERTTRNTIASSGAQSRQYDGLEAMPANVRLNDIVDALEMQFDESSSSLDLDTGQVETVSHALLHEAEESDEEMPDLPTWQKYEW